MRMRFTFEPLTLHDVRAIAAWRYEGQYAYYDLSVSQLFTSWLLCHLTRQLGVYSVYAANDGPVGIFTYIIERDTVEIGLAMRPDLTGKGNGLEFVHAGISFAKQRYSPRHLRLTVAVFNQRARRVYERAGFTPVRSFTRRGLEQLEMARDA